MNTGVRRHVRQLPFDELHDLAELVARIASRRRALTTGPELERPIALAGVALTCRQARLVYDLVHASSGDVDKNGDVVGELVGAAS